mgnify:CR=1 FL=1
MVFVLVLVEGEFDAHGSHVEKRGGEGHGGEGEGVVDGGYRRREAGRHWRGEGKLKDTNWKDEKDEKRGDCCGLF